VLAKIHSFAPNARIYLSRYPRVFGTDTSKWTANSYDHISGIECDVTPGTALTYDYTDATTGAGRESSPVTTTCSHDVASRR